MSWAVFFLACAWPALSLRVLSPADGEWVGANASFDVRLSDEDASAADRPEPAHDMDMGQADPGGEEEDGLGIEMSEMHEGDKERAFEFVPPVE